MPVLLKRCWRCWNATQGWMCQECDALSSTCHADRQRLLACVSSSLVTVLYNTQLILVLTLYHITRVIASCVAVAMLCTMKKRTFSLGFAISINVADIFMLDSVAQWSWALSSTAMANSQHKMANKRVGYENLSRPQEIVPRFSAHIWTTVSVSYSDFLPLVVSF